MFSFSDNNGFEDILDRMLAKIPNTLDKRQGSIIYDALAPAAAELAQCYIALDVYADQTYLLNAVGDNLDNKVADYGLTRIAATYAQRIGTFTDGDGNAMAIPIGSRFSIPTESGGYNYRVITEQLIGTYILQCETAGTVGNEYIGTLLPIDNINNLGSATLGEIYIAGEDEESDDKLRQRAEDKLNETSFGGNVADYKEFMNSQEGVGACLVIPIWNGGGTVKLVVITNNLDIPTEAKINELQTIVDPVENGGQGLGKAPIGHKVTVIAPIQYDITIKGTAQVDSGYTLDSLQDTIKSAVTAYIQEVQKQWENGDKITIYTSRLISAIVSVEGVANVDNLTINDKNANLTIDVASEGNPFPVLKEVNISEG